MSAVLYTLYRPATEEVLRGGTCPSAADALLQARPGSGTAVLLGVKANDITDKVITPADGSEPYVCQRPLVEIEARRPAFPTPGVSELEIITEALRAKGFELSPADLVAAAQAVAARKLAD